MSTTQKIVWIEIDIEIAIDGHIKIGDNQLGVWAEHEGGDATEIEGVYLWDREISTEQVVLVWYAVECGEE